MRNSNITKNRIRVALLLVLAASIIGLAPAFSASARAGSFSINDVSGNYVEFADGWAFGNGVVNFDPISQVGLVTFTPATGTFHEDLIIRSAGTNIQLHPNGTYTVDANGHGTMTWMGMNGPKHRDFYIVNGGAELKWIITDPPGTHVIASNSGTMTKSRIARACSSNLPSRTSSHIWQSAVTLHRVAAFCLKSASQRERTGKSTADCADKTD